MPLTCTGELAWLIPSPPGGSSSPDPPDPWLPPDPVVDCGVETAVELIDPDPRI